MKFIRRKSHEAADAESEAAVPVKSVSRKRSSKKQGKASGNKIFSLLIGDEGAILVFMQGSTVLRRLFASSAQPENTAAFAELMKANPSAAVTVIVDVIDQQYARHTFPPVSAMSIAGLVARRIERDFKPDDMKNALKLGRDEAGRKEWQYLIVSLSNTTLMQGWLDFILELPNRCLGVYLLPVEMTQLLPVISKAVNPDGGLPWQVLISHNKVSGFRQVVLHNGVLVFTRVSQSIEEAIPAVIAGNIEQEIISTLEYLRRMGFTENKVLELIVICAQEVIDSLDLNRFGAGASKAVTPFEVADAIELNQAALSADRFGDVVIAAGLSRMRKRTLLFSNRYIKQLSNLYTIQLGIRILSVLLILGMIGAAADSIMGMVDARNAAQEIESRKLSLQPQLVAVRDVANNLSKDISYKALIVAVHDYYLKDKPLLPSFVSQLAPLIPADMRIQEVQWGNPGTLGASAKPAMQAAGGASKGLVEVHVGIELNGSYANVNEATKAAESMIAELKKMMPEYTITADPFPWAAAKEATQEITLDKPTQKSNPLGNGQNKINVMFVGPQKTVGSAPGAVKAGAP